MFTGILHLISSNDINLIIFLLYTIHHSSTSYGRWVSDDTIKVDALINDTTVRCLSYHLTSFAVLVSVVDLDESVVPIDDNNYTNQTNETTPTIISLEDNLLSIVSYVGCSISIVCLMATVVCLLTLKLAFAYKIVCYFFLIFIGRNCLKSLLILFIST